MSVYIDAPYEASQARIMLPNPYLGDEINPEIGLNIMNAMDGTVFSAVKMTNRVHLNWEFLLSSEKKVELIEFVTAYINHDMRLIDHDEHVYRVKIVNLPLDFTQIRRNGDCSVAVQFEGVQLV